MQRVVQDIQWTLNSVQDQLNQLANLTPETDYVQKTREFEEETKRVHQMVVRAWLNTTQMEDQNRLDPVHEARLHPDEEEILFGY